jgi:hypothetical protein
MAKKADSSKWSKAKIIAQIKAMRKKKSDLSYNKVVRTLPSLMAAANYHFGRWSAAVEAAGIDYVGEVRRVPKWTPERIIAEIQAASAKKADLSWSNVTRGGKFTALAYAAIRQTQFGSWDAALEAAGIDPDSVRRYEAWSKKKIVSQIRARNKAKEPLNSKAMQDDSPRLFNAALNYFGAWEAALRAARISPDRVYLRRRWSKEAIIKDITALYKAGEPMGATFMRRSHSALYSAACKYFGAWTTARLACGITELPPKGRRKKTTASVKKTPRKKVARRKVTRKKAKK